LVGRASRTGPDKFDMDLSKKRVEAVARFLRDSDIPAEQIKSEFIGKTKPLSDDEESAEDRSVQVHLLIAQELTLVLNNASLVPPPYVLRETIQLALESIVRQAGRQLRIVEPWQESTGELAINFSGGQGFGINPCANLYVLGVDGGAEVFVAAF